MAKRTRATFTKEFKDNAVRLMVDGGYERERRTTDRTREGLFSGPVLL